MNPSEGNRAQQCPLPRRHGSGLAHFTLFAASGSSGMRHDNGWCFRPYCRVLLGRTLLSDEDIPNFET